MTGEAINEVPQHQPSDVTDGTLPDPSDDAGGGDAVEVALDDLLAVLAGGELEVVGRLPRSSNATLFAVVRGDGLEVPVVYKPRRGERPLWDFTRGTLCQREVATFVVDASLGWGLVPPTVLRDGPVGVGSVQLWIDVDPDVDMLAMVEGDDPTLVPMAVFDAVVNNADRKVGDCLMDERGHLWGIDHGLTFHDETKLRTVLWAWMGDRLPEPLLADLADFAAVVNDAASGLCRSLGELLSPDELDALRVRVAELLRVRRFPEPDPYGPAVPWPPY